MYKLINNCYGCPECIHCGRNKDEEVFICEECGEIIAEGKKVYELGLKSVCTSCKELDIERELEEETEITDEEIQQKIKEILDNEGYIL